MLLLHMQLRRYFNKIFDNQLERKDIGVNEHERLSNITLRHKLVRKDIDVNENERLSNITLRYKLKGFFCYIFIIILYTFSPISILHLYYETSLNWIL